MSLPRAEVLVEALIGRPVHTYLWREARVRGIDGGVVEVERSSSARFGLADIQAGLDQLGASGEVAVTIAVLGPSATYVAAMLVEVEGAAYADAPARVTLGRR